MTLAHTTCILEILIAIPFSVPPSTPFQPSSNVRQLFYKTPVSVVLSSSDFIFIPPTTTTSTLISNAKKWSGGKGGAREENREHDDCKENQIAKLGIFGRFFCVCARFSESHTIHNPPTLLHADAHFWGCSRHYSCSRFLILCELHTKYSASMRPTTSNLTTTIFPHFDLLPLLALMSSAPKVGVCACGSLSRSLCMRLCLCMSLLSISQITLFHLLLPLLLSLLLLPLHFIISYKFLSCFYPREHHPPAVLPLCTNVITHSYMRHTYKIPVYVLCTHKYICL